MEKPEIESISEARGTLAKILGSIPGAKLHWEIQRSNPSELAGLADIAVEVSAGHRSDTIIVEFTGRGHPRQLDQAISQLLRYRHHAKSPLDYLVVAAPYITAEGAAVCQKEDVGYYDLAGNCRLVFGGHYIERTGNPNPNRKNQITLAPRLYAPKSERVLRMLLHDPAIAWKVVPLAKSTHVSLGTVSMVRTLLLDHEWAREAENGIQLTHPEKLLNEWAAVWKRRRQRLHTYFSLMSLPEIERRMAEFARGQNRRFALTGAAGAWRVAPMTRFIRTQVYWEGDPAELAQGVGLRPAEVGANVQIIVPRDEGVFFDQEEHDGVPVVAPLQLYLDLQQEPARGAEAAEHLWQTRLFPTRETKQ